MKDDLTNRRFGRLTVIGPSSIEKDTWECKCDCGNTIVRSRHGLLYARNPETQSCGCYKREINSINATKMNKTRDNPCLGKYGESEEELIGKRFGKLTIIRFDHIHTTSSGKKKRYFLCKCDCGNEKVISYYGLKYGNTTSCGQCGFKKDLTGLKFGRLTVLGFDHVTNKGESYWKCRCDCGNEIVVLGASLTTGNTRSCGCLNVDVHKDMAIYKDREAYEVLRTQYNHIISRCYDKNDPNYYLYGAKGKLLEWDDFNSFYNDLVNSYNEAKSKYPEGTPIEIDRINNNKGYSKGNVRFVPKITNNLNKSTNKYMIMCNQIFTPGMIADYLNTIKGLSGDIAYTRNDITNRFKDGWTVDMLIQIPDKSWTKSDLQNNSKPVISPIYDVKLLEDIHKSSQGLDTSDIDYLYNHDTFDTTVDNLEEIVERNKANRVNKVENNTNGLFSHLKELGKENK